MNKKFTGIMAFLLVGIVVTAGSVAAFSGMFNKGRFGENLENDAVYQALENADYDAWVDAMKDAERKPSYADVITQEDFDTLVKMHNARTQERAQRQEIRGLIDDAFETGDYETWKNLVEDLERVPPHFDEITADNFDSYAQLHEAMEDGDFETAQTIREDLGFPSMGYGQGNGIGQGAGMGRTMNQGQHKGIHGGQGLGQGQGRFSN